MCCIHRSVNMMHEMGQGVMRYLPQRTKQIHHFLSKFISVVKGCLMDKSLLLIYRPFTVGEMSDWAQNVALFCTIIRNT